MNGHSSDRQSWRDKAEHRLRNAIVRSRRQPWAAKAVQIHRAELILCSMAPPAGFTESDWVRRMCWLCRMATQGAVQEQALRDLKAREEEARMRRLVLERIADLGGRLELSEGVPEHEEFLKACRLYSDEFCVSVRGDAEGDCDGASLF